MEKIKTAREISLKEFNDWLNENTHLTWCMQKKFKIGGFGSKHPEAGPYIKYIYPSIDTRDMKIYHIKTDRFEVDFRDEFDGTILDLLLHKIRKYKEEIYASTST